MWEEEKKKTFKCKYCEKVFRYSQSLKKHCSEKHSLEDIYIKDFEIDKEILQKTYLFSQ